MRHAIATGLVDEARRAADDAVHERRERLAAGEPAGRGRRVGRVKEVVVALLPDGVGRVEPEVVVAGDAARVKVGRGAEALHDIDMAGGRALRARVPRVGEHDRLGGERRARPLPLQSSW